jgi:hypothetical protein
MLAFRHLRCLRIHRKLCGHECISLSTTSRVWTVESADLQFAELICEQSTFEIGQYQEETTTIIIVMDLSHLSPQSTYI